MYVVVRLFVIIVVLFISEARAADYSAKTHFYAVEYLKPVAGMGELCYLNVIFNRKLDAQTTERVLREELQRALSLFPPPGEVMAHAWSETEPTRGSEEMLGLMDGSHFLIYSPQTKQTLTEKQYDVSKQKPPQPGKAITIAVSLELTREVDGRARIEGKTNLPDGMALSLSCQGVTSKYFDSQKLNVVNGRIAPLWFSDGGKPLPNGTYELRVYSPLPALESPAMRAVIGSNGENLLGSVSTWMGSKMVDYKVRNVLK